MVLDQEFDFNFNNHAAVLQRAKSDGAEAFLFIGDNGNQTKFLEASRQIGWTPPKGWIWWSAAHNNLPVWPSYKDVAKNGFYIFSGYNTTFGGNLSNEMKTFQQALQKGRNTNYPDYTKYLLKTPDGNLEPTEWAYTAWIGCRLFQKAAQGLGANLTRQGLMDAIKNLTYDTGFGPIFDYKKYPDKVVARGGSMIKMNPDGSYEQAQAWKEDADFTKP